MSQPPTAPPSPSLIKRLGFTSVLGIGALALPPLGTITLVATAPTTSAWLRSEPVAVHLAVYVAAFAILAGLALLPTYAQSVLGGYAFHVGMGLPGALLGFTLGAAIGYEIAHGVSGDRVERLIEEKPRWLAVRNALLGPPIEGRRRGHGFWKTFLMVALLRLPPSSPFALTNLVMASVRVPRVPYLLGTLVGMLPRTAVAVVIGAGLHEMSKEQFTLPRAVWIAGIVVTVLVVILIGVIANRAWERVAAATSSTPAPAKPDQV